MNNGIKEKLRIIFEDTKARRFWVYHYFSAAVIISALVLILFETNASLYAAYKPIFNFLEYLVTVVFTMEYLSYIWLAKRKRSYLFSFYGIVDILAILPTYLGFANLGFLRALRVVRILKLFRLARIMKLVRFAYDHYSVRRTEKEIMRLNLEVYFVALIIFIAAFSVILFHLEEGVPGTKIFDLEDAWWMIMASITLVGFGDIVPVTFAGRLFVGLVMITGTGFIALAFLIMGKIFQQMFFGEEVEQELRELRWPEQKFEREHERLLREEDERDD